MNVLFEDNDEFFDVEFGQILTGTKDYKDLKNKPSINSVTLEGALSAEDLGLGRIYYDTTENWNLNPSLVSVKGAVYIYSDHEYIENGDGNRKPVPGLRIGDGTSFLIDLPFANSLVSGGISFIGVTTTELSDEATTNPIVIDGRSITVKTGNLVVYSRSEFLFDGTKWIKMGDGDSFGLLAYKDSASGSYTPAGLVSQPTFTGSTMEATGNFTPAGSVSKPGVTVTATTDKVYSITNVGALPELTMSLDYSNESMVIGFSKGELPTKGAAQTVVTGASAALDSAPVFSGTQSNVTVTGTPEGTVSQPVFNGTEDTITVS